MNPPIMTTFMEIGRLVKTLARVQDCPDLSRVPDTQWNPQIRGASRSRTRRTGAPGSSSQARKPRVAGSFCGRRVVVDEDPSGRSGFDLFIYRVVAHHLSSSSTS